MRVLFGLLGNIINFYLNFSMKISSLTKTLVSVITEAANRTNVRNQYYNTMLLMLFIFANVGIRLLLDNSVRTNRNFG
ncbi:hypothetical protein DRP07_09290 [Archaeoglobales archaeon]|nr:MAG: hypothetical protein DRP07_09290 [Archaeoglobales archaeon]